MQFVQPTSEKKMERVADVIRAAGGEIIGRTRLQKMVFFLEIAGYFDDFDFEYRHYGPYSDDVANAAFFGRVKGTITEEEKTAAWGGSYSIFRASGAKPRVDSYFQQLVDITATVNPVALELAATAAFVAINENSSDPWSRTAQLKPEKTKYLEAARELYAKLVGINTAKPLPVI